MNPIVTPLARLARLRFFGVLLLLSFASAPGSAQLVDISNGPLYSGRQAHPNVVVTASVEFPTVGAAYVPDPSDPTNHPNKYVRTSVFFGYFDPTKCYVYNTGNNGYFSVGAAADANHECVAGNKLFSGNFMNWATMSAIDEFRYAMTGGNRDDESGPNNGTLIMRAYLPDGTVNGVLDFYGQVNYFPRHQFDKTNIITYAFGGNIGPYGTSAVSAVLPFPDDKPIYITNCKTYVYFGTVNDGSCNTPQTDLTQLTYGVIGLNVRVNVCDSTEGPLRTDLCQQYGGTSGKYKPVGQVQLNSNQMRFASFGYLMDRDYPANGIDPAYTVPSAFTGPPASPGPCSNNFWNICRYGGVLRSPMKYIGPTTYDSNQSPTGNSRKEINSDGTLVSDPELTASSAGGPYSGFINFINKFGSKGVYKQFDPMGEMLYEAIRYYQNLGPTPLATAGTVTKTIQDFFPITTTWTDPIQSVCAANYIITIGDVNTWYDVYLPGYHGSTTNSNARPSSRAVVGGLNGGLDAYDWTQKIGALESTTPAMTPTPANPDFDAGLNGLQDSAGNTGTSSYLDTGAAFWANTNDIRTDLGGKQTIKTIAVDVGGTTQTTIDRQLYLMGKYGGFTNTIDRASDTFPNPFWATNLENPAGPAIRSDSEWEDSPGSGYPKDYLLASDPQKLISGIRAAFSQIASSAVGTVSGAALTSGSLVNGPGGVYAANFNPARWSGSVLFNSLSVSNGNLVVSALPIWDAGLLLSTRCGTVVSGATTCTDTDVTVNNRNIVTTVQSGGLRVAKSFTWTNVSADTAYATILNTNAATSVVDSLGQQRLNYLRGYRAAEAASTGFRQRDSAMGDVINSAPVYEGAPTTGIADASYQAWFATHAGRTPAVYVGANDGMLHAFNAASGVELFAYIPGFASDDLSDLTDPGYVHESFVDAVPTVQEVKSNGVWKTALVAGVGGGAQGVFALDVTTPTSFSPADVIFEFSDKDDVDFGNVITSPEIVKLQTGVSGGAPVYGWFAVVTGYNNRRTTVNRRTDSRVSADTNNRGVLFVLSLDRTLGTPWVRGTNYYKYTFPASNSAVANGLGPVSSLRNRDGSGSTVALYFGDLQGGLWRIKTVGASPSAWVVPTSPIFRATTAAFVKQPITARPELAPGPFGTTLVYFGTGEYLGQSDLSTPYAQQSEYGLIDDGSVSLITRGTDLQPRTATLSGGNVMITGAAFTYSGTGSKKGWVFDFPSSTTFGERSITKPAVTNGLLAFTTLSLSADICKAGGGYIYQVNALTGLPYPSFGGGQISTVGIPGPPSVIALTNVPGQLRATGEQIGLGTLTTLVAGSSGAIGSAPVISLKSPPVGRINWREITNWNDRH